MMAFDAALFQTERGRVALEKYAAVTHLAVRVYDRDERVITTATPFNRLFELLAKDPEPYLLRDCVRRCFAEPGTTAIVIEHEFGIAAVGAPISYEGEVVCAAIAAYALVGHLDQRQTKHLARNNGLDFNAMWHVVRRSLPIPRNRLPLYGELLRIVGETLVSEHQRSLRLEETLARLEVADRSKDEFLAVLSHELRGPLHAIVGWAQVLRLCGNDRTVSTNALEGIEQSTKEQTKLISELLDVSRIIAGKLTLEIQQIELVPIIKTAVDSVRETANAKHIWIQTLLDPSAMLLRGDAGRLQQICSNLLSNAVKFTPAGGHVTVRLERFDRYVQIQVSDTGRGISTEFLPQIFDKFRQADSSITRQYGGLGLGLAIVKHLVELHGGSVRAESAGESRGSTFTVTLPLLDVPLQADVKAASSSDGSFPHLDDVRVWIIDDNASGRTMMNRLLAMTGAQVTALASAAEALEMLDEWSPDVIVCDIGMPGMDGYTLMRRIRSREPERGGNVPAIAVTGFAAAEDHQRALAAGFQTYFAKPVEPEDFARAIARLVNHDPKSQTGNNKSQS